MTPNLLSILPPHLSFHYFPRYSVTFTSYLLLQSYLFHSLTFIIYFQLSLVLFTSPYFIFTFVTTKQRPDTPTAPSLNPSINLSFSRMSITTKSISAFYSLPFMCIKNCPSLNVAYPINQYFFAYILYRLGFHSVQADIPYLAISLTSAFIYSITSTFSPAIKLRKHSEEFHKN